MFRHEFEQEGGALGKQASPLRSKPPWVGYQFLLFYTTEACFCVQTFVRASASSDQENAENVLK